MIVAVTMATTTVASTGCHVWDQLPAGPHDTTTSYHDNVGMSIEYPEVAECATPVTAAAESTDAPHVLQDPSKIPALEMSLPEAMTMAMQNSPVIRSLASAVPSSTASQTIYNPGLVASSSQGVEAALSNFDAVYTNSLIWSTQDQPANVLIVDPAQAFFAVPVNLAKNAAWQSQLQKKSATGATFSLRHVVNYSRSNRPAQLYPSSFTGWVEAEWRQPLLQGAGLQYNRIVGASQVPGQYNGVLISRINEDVALADYEQSVIQLASDVEQAYWDLWTAYRLLEANLKGRESALKTYQYQNVRLEVGAGRQDEEAQAQSQYYQFEANVQSQLGGPTSGLYTIEQRLRYLLGMPAADGKLIRPTTEPMDMKVVFDWNSALSQALDRRVEVRKQRFMVKRREFELFAARLNKRPSLDLIGLYRWRGFGDHLIGDSDAGRFDGLYSSITDGNYQEWQAGVEFALPVGMRLASTAVSNAKLQLQRDRAILAETELSVSHKLADQARAVQLTFQLVETNYNRYQADLRQVEVLLRRYLDGTDNINFLLQAQRSVVQSESAFYQSLANYNLAIRDLHVQKGSLLAYNQIQLAEGAWGSGATRDAYEKGLFLTPRHKPAEVMRTPVVTRQGFDPSAAQSTGGITVVPNTEVIDGDVPESPLSLGSGMPSVEISELPTEIKLAE